MELEQRLNLAQRPGHPDLLVGLTEAGERNRARQQQEQIQRTQLELEKHRKSHFCERNKAAD